MWNDLADIVWKALQSHFEGIRVHAPTDDLAKDIKTHMPTKLSIMLWSVKQGFITTFQKLKQWGIQIQTSVNSVARRRHWDIYPLTVNSLEESYILLQMF